MEQECIAPISTPADRASESGETGGKVGALRFGEPMNWIRVAVAIGDDPDIHELAEAIDVRVAEAVGLVVGTLVRFPEHAPDGNLGNLRDSLIERWAGWEGDRGRFATELRRIFLTDGVWSSWEKHNGAAMRDAQKARERAAEYRRRNADSMANGTPNGSGNGSLLRTNERTNITTGGRKRPNVENPFAANTPWCVECQGVVVQQANGMPRKVHTPECSRA